MYDDPKIGAVSGRPMSKNDKNNMLGYWSHLLLDAGAHKIRKERFERNEFLECSGYLYSIRNGIIEEIPLDVAEDSVMPLIIFNKGYKIGYAEKALAYLSYPETWAKWKSQKLRCAKAHEKMPAYGGEKVKMKSFKNELLKGPAWALSYATNPREFAWTLALFGARGYIWMHYFFDTKVRDSHYGERWQKIKAKEWKD
jgi:cellulose synthase/poly-beta-1,6-N-acetylglucosamine synthase-like glycosyltransferase